MLPRISLTHALAHLRSTLSTKHTLKSRTCNERAKRLPSARRFVYPICVNVGGTGWRREAGVGSLFKASLKHRAFASASSSLMRSSAIGDWKCVTKPVWGSVCCICCILWAFSTVGWWGIMGIIYISPQNAGNIETPTFRVLSWLFDITVMNNDQRCSAWAPDRRDEDLVKTTWRVSEEQRYSWEAKDITHRIRRTWESQLEPVWSFINWRTSLWWL